MIFSLTWKITAYILDGIDSEYSVKLRFYFHSQSGADSVMNKLSGCCDFYHLKIFSFLIQYRRGKNLNTTADSVNLAGSDSKMI